MARRIPLTNGGFTLVDDQDFAFLCQFSWRGKLSDGTKKKLHAVRDVRLPRGKITIRMHRLIAEAKQDQHVDHINENTLDNRRRNLQIRTNNPWTGRPSGSGFLGVHQINSRRYRSQIEFAGRTHLIGDRYPNAKIAAHAFDRVARSLYGNNAVTNF